MKIGDRVKILVGAYINYIGSVTAVGKVYCDVAIDGVTSGNFTYLLSEVATQPSASALPVPPTGYTGQAFNPGDRIKVINKQSIFYNQTGTVRGPSPYGHYGHVVVLDCKPDEMIFAVRELELLTVYGEVYQTSVIGFPLLNTVTGHNCKTCNSRNDYANSNQADGSYVCYECR